MKRIAIDLGLIVVFGLGLALAVLWLLSMGPAVARAAEPILYVATGGSDTTNCADSAQPCATIQYAGAWSQSFVVTADLGHSGLLTHVVRVTTSEGPHDAYTATSATPITSLMVTKQAVPVLIKAGSPLTYILQVTNTGNVPLTAAITDILPPQVTPTDVLTWTSIPIASGAVWTQHVTTSVAPGYKGRLINIVRVTTREGPAGTYTNTVTSVSGSSLEAGLTVAYPDADRVLDIGFDWMQVFDPPIHREPVNVLLRIKATASDLGNLSAFRQRVYLAARYQRDYIEAYQIGNEVNLNAAGWSAPPSAADYAQVLCAAYDVIKQNDPTAIVVSAGLAPVGRVARDSERQDEREYLTEFIAAGGGNCADVIGYHPIGFSARYNAEPDVDGGTPETNCGNGFCFRGVEKIYEIMQANGLGHKKVWATEVGWITAPPGVCLSDPRWQGRAWQIVTSARQTENLLGAVDYARAHWPWMDAMFVFNLNFDEAAYYDVCEQMRYYSVQDSFSLILRIYLPIVHLLNPSDWVFLPAIFWQR